MKKKGFTLIELLVVIAIIAVLAAILFPVYGRVKTRAKNAPCQNNLKQLATALTAYMDDNEGQTPPVYWVNQTTDTAGVDNWIAWYPWPRMLKNAGVITSLNEKSLKCPLDEGFAPLSYDFNRFLRSSLPTCTVAFYPGTTEIDWTVTSPIVIAKSEGEGKVPPYPTKTVTFFDWRNQEPDDVADPANPGWNQKDGPDVPSDIEARREGWIAFKPDSKNSSNRHGGKANYAFFDGHVESLSPKNIKADTYGGNGNDTYVVGYATLMPWFRNNEPWYDPFLANGSPAAHTYACARNRWWLAGTAGTYPTFNIYR